MLRSALSLDRFSGFSLWRVPLHPGWLSALVLILSAKVALGQSGSSVYFDFDTPRQFSNNFQISVPGLLPTAFTYSNSASGGVNNSPDIDFGGSAGGQDSTAVFMNSAYDFSYDGAVLNISMMVKVKAPTANNRLLQLGFLNRPSTLTAERLTAFMSLRINSTIAPALSYGLQSQSKVNVGGTTIDGTATASVNLVAGNWYRLSATFTNIKATVANSYTISGSLQDMGTNGVIPGPIVLTWPTATTANSDIANDSSVFAAFRGFDTAGADAYDNLAISVGQGPPVVISGPTSQTVLQGRPYVMRAALSGVGPFTYQWTKGDVAIPGATDWQFTNSAAALSDSGVYRLIINGSLTTTGAVLTVVPDTQGPMLVSAGSFDGWNIGACFDESVDSVSATDPSHYSLPGGPAVASVILRADGRSVTLGLAQAVSGSYTLQASNIKDLFNNAGSSSVAGSVNTAALSFADINNPIPPGRIYSCADGDYEISAGGQDVWGGSGTAPYGDQFSFAWLQKSGDFDVRVMVTNETYNIGNGGQTTKAGILARESLDPGSRNIDVYVMPAWPGLNRYEAGLRPSPYANTAGWGIAGDLANQGNVAANHPTSWMRLRRVGDTFTAYTGSDGINWTPNAQTTVTFSNRLYLGLMMCAHSTTFSSATLPTNFSSTALFKGFGATPGYAGAVITLTSDLKPANTNIAAFQTITFTNGVTLTGAPTSELQYQWQRSDGSGGFTNIPGANAASSTYATPALPSSASGSQWRCIVSAAGALSVTSSVATVSTIFDTVAPTLSTAYVPTGSVQQVIVVFSEPVSVGTADVAGNYDVTNATLNSLEVSGASFFGTDGRTILLALNLPVTSGAIHGVVVNNVRDRSAGAISIAPNSFRQFTAPPASVLSSNIVIERFLDNAAVILTSSANSAPRTSVDALLAERKFINNAPDAVNYLNSFGWNPALTNSGGENYGARLSSYFVPPSNGVYRFYTRSDDLNRLFMNTNAVNSTDPAGKVVIADENLACCKNYGDTSGGPNVSPNIPLVAGQRYYIEGLFKEGIGGDGFSMAVRELGDPSTPPNGEVAPNSYFQLPTGPAAVTSISPVSITVAENGFATFAVSGISGALPYKFQWFQGSRLVPNATAFSFRAGPFALNDTNVLFVVSNYFSRAILTANVIVTADTNPPTAVRAFADPSSTNVTVSFSEAVTAGSAENPNNYQIAGLTVLSAALQANGTNVLLATSPQVQGQTYTITMNNIQDRATTPNVIAPNSTISFSGWVMAVNSIKVELFANNVSLPAPRTSVADLLQEPKFINNQPDLVLWTTSFSWNQSPSNSRDNYGGRISGYFVPPSNGVYRFYIRSDDLSQLSMNRYGADPLQKTVIAEQSVACCVNYGDLSGGPNVSAGIPLAGGQKYYMEALFKEGIGGDGFTMAWREAGVTDTPPNSEVASSINFLSVDNPDETTGSVSILQQPSDATVQQNHSATFTVVASSSGPQIGYQWLRNGVEILNANAPTYTTPALQFADESTLYSVKVTIPGRLVLSLQAIVHVTADTQGPTVVAGFGDPIRTHLRVVFDEVVTAATANDAQNYYFSGGQVVTNATLLQDGKTVLLVVDAPIDPSSYYIDVVNVRDLAGNFVFSSTSPLFAAPWLCTNGVALREEFFGNATDLPRGFWFSTLTNNPTFPNNPGYVDYVASLDSPQTVPNIENFSTRLRGFIIPPVSGNYVFQLIADDSGWLLISQDAGPENAATLVRGEGACGACNGLQGGVRLTAGDAYYVEALMMEGGGGDYLDVLWKIPGNTSFTPISGSNLAYCINPDTSLRISLQPTNTTVTQGRTAMFTAAATGVSPIHYQWQRYEPPQGAWFDIAGATNGSYSTMASNVAAQNGTTLRMLAIQTNPLAFGTVASQPATLTVVYDSSGPVPLEASSLSGSFLKVRFDEELSRPIAENPGSWSLPNGVTLISAQLIAEPLQAGDAGVNNTVLLGVHGLTNSLFTVCGFLNDVWGNGNFFCITGHVFAAGSRLDIDEPIGTFNPPLNSGSDPLELGSSIADDNRLEITAGGTDIWNSADAFRYAHGRYTNDFDLRVRVSRLDARNRWSKAGLVVREDLTPGSRNLTAMITAGPSICGGVSACDGSGDTANDYGAGNRITPNGPTSDWANLDHPWGVPYPNAWIRLRRTGDTFTAYWGNNGINWTLFAVTTQPLPPVVYAGLGVSSHNNSPGQTTTAVFHDYSQIQPPIIAIQPGDQIVECRGDAVFTVVATGTALTYQWYYNNAILAGQTAPTLSLSDTTPIANGNYSVIITNAGGSVTSRVALLTVTDTIAPLITLLGSDPMTVDVHTPFNDPGATASDSCAGDLTSQIQSSGPVDTNTVGTYFRYYSVVDPGGNTSQVSRTVYVIDHSPPAILSQPHGTNVPPGATVTFCVSAGGPPLRYQWRKNGRNIPGATNSCLTLTNVQVSDGASYTVAVQNEGGAVLSSSALLTVNVPAVLPGDNFANRVRINGNGGLISGTNTGATKELGEPAHAGNPGGASVWYVWQAPSTGIATFDTIGSAFDTLLGIYRGTNVTQLSLVVDDDDGAGSFASRASFNAIAGTDYAIAIDGFGAMSGYFVLHWNLEVTAQQIPVIVSPPTSITVAPGASHTFSVTPQNTNLTYQFQWFFNGQPIGGATNRTLTISNITEAVLGSYLVDVSFGSRLVETKAASLQINLTGAETEPVLAFDKLDDAINSPTQLRLGTPSGQGGGLVSGPKSTAAASVARGYTGTQIFNSYGAGSEGGEEIHCGIICGVSEWIPFVAEENGRLYVNTDGSSFDTVIAIYIRVSGVLTQVGCDNNSGTNHLTSAADVPVVAGQTNFLVVDGVGGATGSLHLNYSLVTQGSITSSSLSGGAFHLHLTGHTGMKVAIQASSNLTTWQTIATITAVGDFIDYTETPLPNGAVRFYRALMLPF